MSPNFYGVSTAAITNRGISFRILAKRKGSPGKCRDREVNFVNGCSTLIRREVFEKLHGFDESLFLYAEDLDLCIKCSASGESLFACADSVVPRCL